MNDPRYVVHDWQPHERPPFPGSPSTPRHPLLRRVQYGAVGTLVALTGGLGNAVVAANLPYLQGSLGADAWEMAWLPAAYAMSAVSANLLLVKFRQQFGLRLFTEMFLVLYVLTLFAHLFVDSLGSAIAVRAANGMVGAALYSLGIFYMIQAFPNEHRIKALVLALGLTQLALPLARVFPIDLLRFGEWRGLYLAELGLALLTLACVLALKLPPSDRYRVFEKLDFLTFGVFAAGAAGLATVLSLGRYLWWTESAWLGATLAASVGLLCLAGLIEHGRRNPLLNLRWLASGGIVRLAAAIVLIRIALSEQSTGAVGFFQMLGLTNEQMQTMFGLVLAGAVCGIAVSAATLRRETLAQHLIVAVAAIAAGAFMDAGATHDTRPQQMYLSQFLLAFGSTFFIAPAMLTGVGQVIGQPRNFISFVVLFSMTQNMGSLFGSAFLGTLQTWREKFHSSQLADHLVASDPQVAAWLQTHAAAYAHVVTDPAQRQALALRALAGSATREANVLAYNDVFLVFAWLAIATAAWLLGHLLWQRWRNRAGATDLPPTSSIATR